MMPADLDAAAAACFSRVQARLQATGQWDPLFAPLLASVASECSLYLLLAREARAHPALERTHRTAREGLAEFLMIAEDRVPFTVVNAEGLDEDIAALCATDGLRSAEAAKTR